jgi:hypothetical protein
MFDFLFKRKAAPAVAERRLRAVQPTYVTKDIVVLSKVAPIVRNTYEIRLALYMAKSKGMRFVLAVRPQAQVDESVLALLKEHGGKVEEATLDDYSVYFGRSRLNGDEDGWVLGDAAAMSSFVQALRSEWLRERLQVGATFSGADLAEFEAGLRRESIAQQNIDSESIQDALLSLITDAKQDGGTVFVQ